MSPRLASWLALAVFAGGIALGQGAGSDGVDPAAAVAALLALGTAAGALAAVGVTARRALLAVGLPPLGLWLAAVFC